MAEKLTKWFIGVFGGLTSLTFGKELLVFIISLLPILELRGGLIAASLLGLDPLPSYIISIVGNVLPIPLILWCINSILNWMRKSKSFKKFALFLDDKVNKKKSQIEKYGYLGLILFVGIPLPGTGAWTGSLIAAVLEMDRKKSFLAILAGVVLASVIMMVISFGLLRGIIN